jgi:hypothetical protein
MKTKRILVELTALLVIAAMAAPTVRAQERYLHVRVVEAGERGETVRVNLPLALAEAVLPAIKVNQLQNGKLRVHHAHIEDVDLHAILDAVRKAKDGEFVTVDSTRENVRVAKQAGYLLVEVREQDKDGKERNKVDVKLPLTVMEALLSGGKDELDLLAAIRALAKHGDADLVSVKDRNTTVRIWVDTKSTSE